MNLGKAIGEEIKALTGIRAVAAILVVILHFMDGWVSLIPQLAILKVVTGRGGIGVDFFFVLSGFIISYVYRADTFKLGGREYRKFIWLRFARIYPTHFAMLVLLIAMVVTGRYMGLDLTGEYPMAGLPNQFTMTQVWPFALFSYWNYPAWSISAEWFAYLFIFPVSWVILRSRLSGVVLFILGYITLALLVFATEGRALYQVSFEFLAGSFFCGVFLKQTEIVDFCQRYCSWLCLLAMGVLAYPCDYSLFYPLIMGLIPLVLLGLTSEETLAAKALALPGMLWLGRISYALYMTHGIAIKVFKIVTPYERYAASAFPVRSLLLFTHCVVLLVFAAGVYYLIEIPARRFLREVSEKGAAIRVAKEAKESVSGSMVP